jgi:hypothetical protein
MLSVRERDRIVAMTASRKAVQVDLGTAASAWQQRDVFVTQNRVLAAPSQKNSPTAPDDSLASFGGAMRTAKSIPNPTCPLPGSHDFSVTSFGMASVAMSFTVSGLRMRARPSFPPPSNMRANFM